MAVTLKFIYHTEPSSQKIGPYIHTINDGQQYTLTNTDIPVLSNYNGKQFSYWKIINTQYNIVTDSGKVKVISVTGGIDYLEFHFYAVWSDAKIPLQFLVGDNIKQLGLITPGTIYFNSTTKELWFDNPAEDTKEHLKIIDTDTFLYEEEGQPIQW